MPKIIKNLPGKLLEEAQRQIQEAGYSAMTIRSVAKACGVGVGTVYNYFPSKEDLIASYLLDDWKACIAAIEEVSAHSDNPKAVLQCVYSQLVAYARRHGAIFRDAAATTGFAGSFGKYHALLRKQLAAPVRKFCPSDFAAEFIVESLLVWSMDGRDFEEIFGMIGKLL